MPDVATPLAGTVVALHAAVGALVRAGDVVAVVESMKMEHEIRAAHDGAVTTTRVGPGDSVGVGDVLIVLRALDLPTARDDLLPLRQAPAGAPPPVRPDLHELHARHALLADASRPEAVARRHALGLRTARENIAGLCDPGSFVE